MSAPICDISSTMKKPIPALMKRRRKEATPETLYCGLSIYTVALLGIVVIILCNWLIDLQFYADKLLEIVKGKPLNIEDIANSVKQPLPVVDGWVTITPNKIRTVQWTNSSALKNLTALNEPLLINHDSIKSWPLFKWNLWRIANKSNLLLEGTRWQPESVFVLGQEREKGGMLGSPKDHLLTYTNVTLRTFLHRALDEKHYLYWTGELSAWQDQLPTQQKPNNRSSAGLFNDWRDFRVKEEGLSTKKSHGPHGAGGVDDPASRSSAIDEEEDEDVWRPMLWLSHPGVVAQTHYDTQHNVFVQILGTKRFLLFPPGTELYSYPNIHRSYRQSQLHLEAKRSAGEAFSLAHPSNVTAFEVVVRPGDVLYIPPFWQHRVESLTLSLSLSVLSPSYLEASLAEVYWENVPFGEFMGSRELRTRAVALYLSLLVEQLPSSVVNMTLRQFAQQLYETRFATLDMAHRNFTSTAQPACFEPMTVNTSAVVAGNFEKFQLASSNVVAMLAKIHTSDAVKVIFLRDYVEQLVRWAVGPDLTARFIGDCLE